MGTAAWAPKRLQAGRLHTAEGEIGVQVPQVRDWIGEGAYRSSLMAFLRGNSDVLNCLAAEMYARGLSVRDIEDVLQDAMGKPLLSRTAVSELRETLWEDYQAFCERDLSSFAVEYVFIDVVYEDLRPWGCSQGLLCAWAICRDGRKVMLHLTLGGRESYDNCLAFLRDMVRRGLRLPVLVATDGAPGLISAVEQVWSKSLCQRCLAHKMRNILDKVSPAARRRSNAAYRMSSMRRRWKPPRSVPQRCCVTTRRSIRP
jgi:transposase-like protein